MAPVPTPVQASMPTPLAAPGLVLLREAQCVVTMNPARREIAGGAVAFDNGVVVATGTSAELAPLAERAAQVIDARGCVITPGLVNTHHHLFQTLTRSLPGAINVSLFGWRRRLYPIWARYRPEDVFAATQLGLAELALSGCAMSSDHHYLFPDGVRLDDSIHAAREVGLRFHATRGSMSVGESSGGLPPDSVVEDEDAIFGVSLSLALGLQLEPAALQHLPETLRILLGSGVLPAALCAVVLNLAVPGRTG